MNIKLANTPFVKIKEVTIPDIYFRRMKCGIEKIDAMFGDGILPGASVTVTARAGLGKTTLVLQMLEGLNKNGYRVGYCSSEESVAQLAMTCKRLNVHDVSVCNESDVDTISKHMDNLDVIVVDSFQGLCKGNKKGRDLEKYCIEKLVVRAKETECAVILICHNTKSGVIKGSSLIIHAVDVNISISGIKDAEANARVIRFDKNRFGPAIDLECFIEYSGYDFESEVEHSDDEKDKPKDKPTKADRKNEQRNKLLDLIEKKTVNIAEVCKALAVDATRASFLLRELTTEGLVIKDGRGAEAEYKLVEQE